MIIPQSFLTYLSSLVMGKHVVILGFAREGQSTYKLLRSLFTHLKLTVLDQNLLQDEEIKQILRSDKLTTCIFGKHYLQSLSGADVIFKSPGISPLLLQIQEAKSQGAVITSQTAVFFEIFHRQIIAVTGTKGKSTTCAVISHVLETCGKKVLFLGNIGRCAFDHLERIENDTFIVYETSSYQCEGLGKSPHIGVFMNVYRDHLDHYDSPSDYEGAKKQLFMHQTPEDFCIYNCSDDKVTSLVSVSKGRHMGFCLTKQVSSLVYEEKGLIFYKQKALMPIDQIPLLGRHNLLNCMPSIVVGKILGLDTDMIIKALSTVKPVAGRLETVAQVGGIKFVDDALATIPEATIAAISTFGENVYTLIAGGFDRGQDFFDLARVIAAGNIKNLILFAPTGKRIAQAVTRITDQVKILDVPNMSTAVTQAYKHTPPGKIVLLSTASPSFGLFTDYRDRSRQYKAAISKLDQENLPLT